jgi:23S rRNA (cytosine1962-C5)-methyltransferase
VNRRAAERVESGHPWIFRSDVLDIGEASPGDLVRVTAAKQTLGSAHFSGASQITLRMLSPGVVDDLPVLLRARIERAAAHRDRVVHGSNAYRLVFSEADELPGLIIDRYAHYFVVQFLNQGMDRATPLVTGVLESLFHPKGILARNDASVRTQEDLPRESRVLTGEIPASVEIEMNGFRLAANLLGGMKTGIFLDQRENYVAAASFARGSALDCFTSTGGFALHLARTCEQITGIDSSESALALARANAKANGIGNIHFREADVFDALAGYAAAKRTFDTIVLDPPAFAKARGHKEAAGRAYKEINRRALQMLNPGGTLVTCSCSHHVSEADLLEVVAEAALESGRTLRVMERRAQAKDHPILLTVPETLYLKCLILQSLD